MEKPKIDEKAVEALKEAQEKRIKQYEEAKLAINSVGENPNVRIVLQHILRVCGVFENPAVLNNDREITNATTYNVGRQSVYSDIRKLMSVETRNQVERSE